MITQPINVMLCAYWTLAIVPSMPAPTEGNRSPYLLFILFLHPLNISRYLYLSLSLSLSLCNSVSLFLCHCVSLSLYIFLPFFVLSFFLYLRPSISHFLSLSVIHSLSLSVFLCFSILISLSVSHVLSVCSLSLCLSVSLSLCLSSFIQFIKKESYCEKKSEKVEFALWMDSVARGRFINRLRYKSCTAQLHNFQNNCNGVLAIFMLSLSRQFWFRPGSFE